MERIPFDIKFRPDIEAGKYLVVTRGNEPARIICWDRTGYYPIVALVQQSGKSENAYTFSERGEYDDSATQTDLDLCLIPNPDYKEPTAEPSVDWDAFRREASLQIAAGFATNGNFLERSIGHLSEDIADCAVVTADMLIKKLKGE